MNTNQNSTPAKTEFTRYEAFIIAVLSILQFTIILDFMILSPLGAILMPALKITPSQFGVVVSAYAFSAGASGLLAAGFADRFDRKYMLLFFYVGFVLGTVLCAIAPSYELLLGARIVTGIFGGVISAISFAIVTDLFKMEVRGRVMGYMQMSFAASQILGIPIGFELAERFSWHYPFWMIAIFASIIGVIIVVYMKPINEHLKIKSDRNVVEHLWKTLSNPNYLKGFLATTLLATGGFMLMPFGSAFSTNNLNIDIKNVSLVFAVTGVSSVLFGPFIGRLSDKIGKYKMFVIGSAISFIMVAIYTNLGATPLGLVMVINVLLFVGISSRMISSQALTSALPEMKDRGAFMSINSSVQQISGGTAAVIAGKIVVQSSDGMLHNYNVLGYVVMASITIAIGLFYILNEQVQKNTGGKV